MVELYCYCSTRLFYTAPRCGNGITYIPTKPPNDSSMTHEESDDLSFWASNLEELVKGFKVELDDLKKGFVRTIDLFNLEEMIERKMEKRMENMDTKMEERMHYKENTL